MGCRDWDLFIEDFESLWPTGHEKIDVDSVHRGLCGNGAARKGNPRWRRITEIRARGAKSVFHFDVLGSVAKSTHAGLPWLLHIRRSMTGRVHFWPFDGWSIPPGRSAVVEAYPALWSGRFPRGDRDQHQHDAYAIAEWMRRADADGSLTSFLNPVLSMEERKTASFEGWILGVA